MREGTRQRVFTKRRLAAALAVLVMLIGACSSGTESADEKPSTTEKGPQEVQPDQPVDEDEQSQDAAPTQADEQETGAVTEVTSEFFEDFSADEAMSRFDVGVFHRDDHLVRVTEWPGDHVSTGEGDLCGPPTEKRTVQRGERVEGFNDDWIYRCVPGGDLEKAHVMTTIGATSGYSIGAFTPKPAFEDIQEIRWDVNQTDLGARQWTELVLIPVAEFDFQNLPCMTGLPCSTVTHEETGSIGTHWAGTRVRVIVTPDQPNGYKQSRGARGYRCKGCSREPSMRFGEDYGVGDPALTSIVIRRENFFRDNGDGTLTWGYELDNESFQEFSVPGSFPDGPLKVVFKDHNYTPLKSPATLLPETTFTWHWDNIEINGKGEER